MNSKTVTIKGRQVTVFTMNRPFSVVEYDFGEKGSLTLYGLDSDGKGRAEKLVEKVVEFLEEEERGEAA